MVQISIHGGGGDYSLAKWFWHVIRKNFMDVTIYSMPSQNLDLVGGGNQVDQF